MSVRAAPCLEWEAPGPGSVRLGVPEPPLGPGLGSCQGSGAIPSSQPSGAADPPAPVTVPDPLALCLPAHRVVDTYRCFQRLGGSGVHDPGLGPSSTPSRPSPATRTVSTASQVEVVGRKLGSVT